MSNHRHLITQTDCPEKVMRLTRLGYTRHMNTKYKRCGPLGESEYFCIELDGIYHQIAAITYAMRNPLHHGVVVQSATGATNPAHFLLPLLLL